jgi:hypothetical protein
MAAKESYKAIDKRLYEIDRSPLPTQGIEELFDEVKQTRDTLLTMDPQESGISADELEGQIEIAEEIMRRIVRSKR